MTSTTLVWSLFILGASFLPDERVQADPTRIPALIRQLTSLDSDDRYQAQKDLANLGPKAIPALIDALADADEQVRSGVARVLGYMGPGAREAVPALIHALKNDRDQYVRGYSADALAHIDDKVGVPALLDTMKTDSDLDVRYEAARALGQFRSQKKLAISVLTD